MDDGTLDGLIERIVRTGVDLTTRALTDASPGLELTFPQWRVLLVLGQDSGGATVSEVAGHIGVTVPATSRQLRRLARRGFVAIERDERDRRAARARLTVAGHEIRATILAHRRGDIAASVAGLDTSEATLRQLGRVADALDGDR